MRRCRCIRARCTSHRRRRAIEPIPGPRHGHVWVPGYWQPYGGRHNWVAGHWVVQRPGYVYAQPAWREHDGRWHMDEGRWERRHGHGYGQGRRDFDRDGVPNRYDRDVDGDGVPNRYDRRAAQPLPQLTRHRPSSTDAKSRHAAGALDASVDCKALAAACCRPSQCTCRRLFSPVRFLSRCSALIVLCAALAATAATPARRPWVAAWAAAAQDHAQSAPPLPGIAPQPALTLPGQTVRQRLLPGLDGQRVRVRFSNAFGKQPLHIAAASIARSTGNDAVSPGSLRPLRFNRGRPDVTIAPGAEAWSDPVAIRADAGQPLAVSFHLDRDTPIATVHHRPLQASWIAPGNAVAAPQLGSAARRVDWNMVVTGLDVEALAPTRVVVAFGDSITEGMGASSDVVSRPYPERLGERLRQPNGDTVPVSVLNAGIGGNRLLAPRMGPRGLDRFDAMRWT